MLLNYAILLLAKDCVIKTFPFFFFIFFSFLRGKKLATI